jgi:hypothetical protein
MGGRGRGLGWQGSSLRGSSAAWCGAVRCRVREGCVGGRWRRWKVCTSCTGVKIGFADRTGAVIFTVLMSGALLVGGWVV